MNIITLDFETYYDSKTFTLKKQTTEEYVRSPEFQAIGVAVKVNNGETDWASGTHKEIRGFLKGYDFENSMLVCQNTMFDGFILSEIFGIYAKRYADTMLMAKAIHGFDAPASLKALAELYGVGHKGTEVISADGMRREDFTEEELSAYGDYCINDVELTYDIFSQMVRSGFPKKEMQLIDLTLKMFVRPRLVLDKDLLTAHLKDIQQKKEALLTSAGHDKDDLMSNLKFAELLRSYGVVPPTKISPTTGKEAFAFAKNDAEFLALQEHEDFRVQAIVAARLGVKSTLEETRTERLLGIAERGKIPVPLAYYAAHTGRWGGSDKINFQNFPSRGENAGKIKNAILAPEGYMLVDSDSSQIEARVLAWLSGQEDLVTAFREGRDVYKIMASAIYGKPVEEITKPERFMGKTVVLGCGYGLGAVKFRASLALDGVSLTEDEAADIIRKYRDTYPHIVALWRRAQLVIERMVLGDEVSIGPKGVLRVIPEKNAILLPSGLLLPYKQLRESKDEKGKPEYQYKSRYGWNRIYGGKVVENICQAVARCIIGEQMILIAKRYEVTHTVHDAIACIVPEDQAEEAQAYVEECMRWVPEWAEGLPVNCESGYGRSYGEC
jgi:DNA polymerase I-like protein with 3'-5' exonuclease and polymerase domains